MEFLSSKSQSFSKLHCKKEQTTCHLLNFSGGSLRIYTIIARIWFIVFLCQQSLEKQNPSEKSQDIVQEKYFIELSRNSILQAMEGEKETSKTTTL